MRFKNGTYGERRWICFILLLIVFFSIFAYGGEYIWDEAPAYATVFLLLGFAVFKFGVYGLLRSQIRLLIPFLLLSLYSILHGLITLLTLIGQLAPHPWLPFSYDFISSIWCGIKILGFTCFLALCIDCLKRYQSQFVWGLVWIGNLFAILGIIRFAGQTLAPNITEKFSPPLLNPGIGFGSFLNQNHFATLMLMVLGLQIGLLACLRLPTLRRILLVIGCLTVIVATILTASRAGIIGSFVVIGTLILTKAAVWAKRKPHVEGNLQWVTTLGRGLAVFVFVSMVLFLGVFYIGQDRVVQRFAELPQQIEANNGNTRFRRLDVWKATTQLIRQHPVFGIGFGGFQYAITEVMEVPGSVIPKQSHDDYLELIASGGLFSLGIGLWVVYLWARSAQKSNRSQRSGFWRAARTGAMCGVAGASFHAFFDFGLQYSANLFFFGALVAILVEPGTKVVDEVIVRSNEPISLMGRLNVGILMLILASMTIAFGVSRYSLTPQAQHRSENELIGLPIDPEYLKTRASLFEQVDKPDRAIDDLRAATEFRPKDFHLWLSLASVEYRQKLSESAAPLFERAANLAPFTSEPHYYYGMYLAESGQVSKGLDELVFAARRDKQLLDAVVETIWRLEKEPIDKLSSLAADEPSDVRERIFDSAIEKYQYKSAVDLACKTSTNQSENELLIHKLLEHRQYLFAWKVHKHECGDANSLGELIDGDFEGKMDQHDGFGWIYDNSKSAANLALDRTDPQSGQQSLRLKFDGNFLTPFVTQTVIVESNTEYNFSFYYKSDGIIAGSLPIIQLVLEGPNEKQVLKEIEIKGEKADWRFSSTSFETNSGGEALEISVMQRPCGQSECPIFGNLWVDDFQIAKTNRIKH